MHKPTHYKANRGGHAPGYLRDAFLEWLEEYQDVRIAPETCEYDDETVPVNDVLGLLWNCTDIMPSWDCDTLDLRPGSTYARGVRKVKELRV